MVESLPADSTDVKSVKILGVHSSAVSHTAKLSKETPILPEPAVLEPPFNPILPLAGLRAPKSKALVINHVAGSFSPSAQILPLIPLLLICPFIQYHFPTWSIPKGGFVSLFFHAKWSFRNSKLSRV